MKNDRGERVGSLSSSIHEFLPDFVKGKSVLDVGCVEHTAKSEEVGGDSWLHRNLSRTASSLLGLDILTEDVAKLRARGYNMVAGDAVTLDIGRRFDVVVAGELIEHLDAPSAFLTNMARHLEKDGRLVLTTPNVFYATHFVESLFLSPDRRWNPEHVAWYCPFTLRNLIRRSGFEIESCLYFSRSRKIRWFLRTFHIPCYGPLASSILLIARKRDE